MKPLNELTDAELSECFAVEVAGWTKPNGMWTHPNGTPMGFIPPFSTSADAVLPWLEKHLCVSVTWAANGWHVVIHTETGSGDDYDMPVLGQADDAALSRAACIALIEAKRRDGK